MDSSVFSQRLSELRKAASLSQSRVAEAIGVSRQAVGKWESGKAVPSLALCGALAALYGVSADELLTGAPFEGDCPELSLQEAGFAERLRALRGAQNVSQGELADRLGVSRQSVSKWESGKAEPDLDRVVALSQALGVPTALLLPTLPSDGEKAEKESAQAAPEMPEEPTAVKAPEESAPVPPTAEEESAAPAPTEATEESTANAADAPSAHQEPKKQKGALLNCRRLAKKLTGKKTAKEKEEENKKAKKESKRIQFRTIAELEPNEPAYVYVNKNDGKVRTILPFLASIPICTLAIALIIKKKFKK